VLAVGSELGHSDWHSVTQSQIDQFAAATGDDQWIHTDADRAARGLYGATIAHGYLTVALIPRLLHQVFVVEGLTMRVNYGSNRIRFPAPVPVGSRIRAVVQLRCARRQIGQARAVLAVTIEIEGSERPACVAEVISLLKE
jgi:acyl dehydratase